MLNKNPAIVNGFGRGGTNILMNFLLSHPALAMPSGELNKVFKGGAMGEGRLRKVFKKNLYDKPVKAFAGDIFDRFSFKERADLSAGMKRYIDFVIWIEKQFAKHEGHNKWKNETMLYTSGELRKCRLTVKAHNGLVFLNDMWRRMYSDVVFVAIVRDGYAVCESLLRRGWSIEDAAHLYNSVGREILANAGRPDYLIVKFEDVLYSPLKAIEQIYNHCGLHVTECEKFRLQHKSVATCVSGKSVLHGDYDRQVEWFDRGQLVKYFKPDVNKNQVDRLNADQVRIIDFIAGETIAAFGYGR